MFQKSRATWSQHKGLGEVGSEPRPHLRTRPKASFIAPAGCFYKSDSRWNLPFNLYLRNDGHFGAFVLCLMGTYACKQSTTDYYSVYKGSRVATWAAMTCSHTGCTIAFRYKLELIFCKLVKNLRKMNNDYCFRFQNWRLGLVSPGRPPCYFFSLPTTLPCLLLPGSLACEISSIALLI